MRIVTPDPGAWRGLEAWVSRLDPKEPLGRKTYEVAIGDDGTFRSGPLVTGAPYAIWIPAGRTGLTALKADVRGTDGEMTLTPVPGQTIRGRVVADKPLNHPFRWVDAYGTGWHLRMSLDVEGRFELRGVPDGSCVLRGEATIGETYYTGMLRGRASRRRGRRGSDRTRQVRDSPATFRRRAALLVALFVLFGLGAWMLVRSSLPKQTDVGSDRLVEVGGAGGGPRPMLEGSAPSRASVGGENRGSAGASGSAAESGAEEGVRAFAFDVEWPSIRVVGPGGAVVRSAAIEVRIQATVLQGEVRDGRVFLTHGWDPDSDLSEVELEVTSPVAADPKLLLAPVSVPSIARGTRSKTVELPAAVAIEGRVVGPDGEGVDGARVSAFVSEPDSAAGEWWTNAHGSTLTGDGGHFRLRTLARETYALATDPVGPWIAAAMPIVRAPSRGVILRMVPGVTLRVQVLDPQGMPVSGARVTVGVNRPDPGWRLDPTDPDGYFTIPEWRPGRVAPIVVFPPAERRDLHSASIPSFDERTLTIRLEHHLSITGIVRAPDGTPVSDVRVEYDDMGWGRALVDVKADGTFAVEGLEAGKRELRATTRTDLLMSGEVEPGRCGPTVTAAAGDRDVELAFTPGVTMRVVVAGEHPEHVGRRTATLSWTRDDGRACSWRIRPAKHGYVLPHLVEGVSYTLSRTGRSVEDPALFETFVARAGQDITVQPRTPIDVTGRVTRAEGSVRREFLVVAVVAGFRLLGTGVDGDLTFTLRGLPLLPERVMLMGVDSEEELLDSVPVTRAGQVIELREP